jgi:hypothetical protein
MRTKILIRALNWTCLFEFRDVLHVHLVNLKLILLAEYVIVTIIRFVAFHCFLDQPGLGLGGVYHISIIISYLEPLGGWRIVTQLPLLIVIVVIIYLTLGRLDRAKDGVVTVTVVVNAFSFLVRR